METTTIAERGATVKTTDAPMYAKVLVMKEIQFHLNVLLILGVHLSTGVSLIHCYQNTSATLWGSEELPGH